MTVWSKPHHKLATSSHEALSENFKFGIELSLGQLIETRTKPIIQWLAPNSKVKTNRIGGFRSRFKGLGMDFDEVRLYQNGDDIRNIDWRVTARTGEAHTKLFKEERERPVFVVLDQMPSMFFGTASAFKSLIASKIASQIMWHSLNNGDRFGALLFGQNSHSEMKPSSNRRNCMRLLSRIVESYQLILNENFIFNNTDGNNIQKEQQQRTAPKNPLSETLKRLRYLAKPGTLIHIISDFNLFDEDCQGHLSRLSQHTDIHCVLVKDPIESELPPSGLYGITDGTQKGYLNTRDKTIRKNYRQQFEKKQKTIKEFVLGHKGIYTCIDTNYKQESTGIHGSSVEPTDKQTRNSDEQPW